MRIATWNVNSLKARLDRVTAWLEEAAPDVLCMQETKLADAAFPTMAFQALGYECAHHGDGRWNGVAVCSRVGLQDVRAGFAAGAPEEADGADGPDGAGCRLLAATCGGVRVHSVYVPNGRSVGSEHYQQKLRWLASLRQLVAATCRPDQAVAVCGDMNVAPEDRDVWDPAAFEGSTHVTPEERAALADLLDWGLVDVFRRHYPEDGLFTWWDYRAGSFHKRQGLRIDLVLLSRPLADRCAWALMDRNARKGQQPSDHAPVLVDVDGPDGVG